MVAYKIPLYSMVANSINLYTQLCFITLTHTHTTHHTQTRARAHIYIYILMMSYNYIPYLYAQDDL